jgi:hypothetical protein
MSFAIGLAGMNAAGARLEASAAIIARTATVPSPLSATQAGTGAVARGAGRGPEPVTMPVPADPATAGTPAQAQDPADIDLPAAMVEQIAAGAAFLASLNVVRREDDALEALLRER